MPGPQRLVRFSPFPATQPPPASGPRTWGSASRWCQQAGGELRGGRARDEGGGRSEWDGGPQAPRVSVDGHVSFWKDEGERGEKQQGRQGGRQEGMRGEGSLTQGFDSDLPGEGRRQVDAH